MPRFVFALWRTDGVNGVSARIDLFANALNGATLARGVPTFEQNDDGPLLQVHLAAKLAELNLPAGQLTDVGLAIERLSQIDGFEH